MSFLILGEEEGQLLGLRWESKGAALYEFACELVSRKASTASRGRERRGSTSRLVADDHFSRGSKQTALLALYEFACELVSRKAGFLIFAEGWIIPTGIYPSGILPEVDDLFSYDFIRPKLSPIIDS